MIVKQKEIVELAKDMNMIMKLVPVIDPNGTPEDLKANITGEAIDIRPTDALSDASWATLGKMGLASVAIAARAKKAEKVPAEAPKAPAKAPEAKAPEAKAKAPVKAPVKAPAKAAVKKEDKGPRYTRNMAFASAIKSGIKDEEKLIAKADEIYIKNTGAQPNLKEAAYTHNKAIGILLAMELVTVEDNKVTYKG